MVIFTVTSIAKDHSNDTTGIFESCLRVFNELCWKEDKFSSSSGVVCITDGAEAESEIVEEEDDDEGGEVIDSPDAADGEPIVIPFLAEESSIRARGCCDEAEEEGDLLQGLGPPAEAP